MLLYMDEVETAVRDYHESTDSDDELLLCVEFGRQKIWTGLYYGTRLERDRRVFPIGRYMEEEGFRVDEDGIAHFLNLYHRDFGCAQIGISRVPRN